MPRFGGVFRHCHHFIPMAHIHQHTRCLVDPSKRARVRSPFASVENEQEYKAKLVIARQLRKQKGKQRPSWTIPYLVRNYTLQQLTKMLGTVRFA